MSSVSRSILITGGTSGLGFHAATAIARRCPDSDIVIASRKDPDKAADAINTKLGQRNVQFMPLDLGNSKNVRSFVNTWAEKKLSPISVLLLNAGLQFPGEVQYTADGLESTFGINHVGHALLFHLLQPYIAEEARIVVTASGTHDPAQKSGLPDAKYDTAEKLAHPPAATLKTDGRQHYSTSKLCNVLWSYALDRRLSSTNKKWTVVAFDPGLMPGTGLARDYGLIARFLWHKVLPALIPLLRRLLSPNVHTAEESGRNMTWVALDDRNTSGKYYEARKQIPSSKDSYDEKKQEDLWEWTVNYLAQNQQEKQKFEALS
ncbi:dehydrogenase/reductase [Exophiala viscosa]|uniref:Dehydrogenase/reductase n=1 Tax=Exophiala viscosa TaxID=2486360 RepID=A0AAN6I9K6_9EURO|nr:dehydrogenase/reductase [Exophiala viscosa]KAI1620689.1 dehydrogenase/reductase [Exophiala viscosa]